MAVLQKWRERVIESGLLFSAAVQRADHRRHRLHPAVRIVHVLLAAGREARRASGRRWGSSSPTPSGRPCSPTRISASCRWWPPPWSPPSSPCASPYRWGTIVAIYLSEYAPFFLREILKPVLELLSAVPTVVYGYFRAPVRHALAPEDHPQPAGVQHALRRHRHGDT